MRATCFHLHAVLVHQGQASAGHYWAYVRRPQQQDGRSTAAPGEEPGGRGQLPGPGDEPGGRGRVPGPGDEPGGRGQVPGPGDEPGGRGQVLDVTIESQSESEGSEEAEVAGVTEVTGVTGTGGPDICADLLEPAEPGTTMPGTSPGVQVGGASRSMPTLASPAQPSVFEEAEQVEGGGCGGVGKGEGMEVVGCGEEVWLKFNDVSVSEVGWGEVEREGRGGRHNTSAYCLVYISSTLHQQGWEEGEWAGWGGRGASRRAGSSLLQAARCLCRQTWRLWWGQTMRPFKKSCQLTMQRRRP